MKIEKINDAVPLIATTIGGIAIGVIARNGFISWTGETFAAGLLGLAGGYLAYRAAQTKQSAEERRNAVVFKIKYNSKLKEVADIIEKMIDHHEAGHRSVNRSQMKEAWKTLNSVLSDHEPLPNFLAHPISQCAVACDLLNELEKNFLITEDAALEQNAPDFVFRHADSVNDHLKSILETILRLRFELTHMELLKFGLPPLPAPSN